MSYKDVSSMKFRCQFKTVAILSLWLTFLLSGCQVLTDSGVVQKPSASLSDLSVKSLSAQGVLFDAVLKVKNPNPVALSLAGYDYDFQVSGKSLLSGQQDVQTQIGAAGESLIRVPLQLKFSDLQQIGQGLSKQKTLNYALKTTAQIDLPVLGRMAFPAEKSGEVPLPQMPKVAVSSLEVKSLGLTGADLALTLNIDNPNVFGIDISHLKSGLKVDGVSWLDATLSKALTLSPEQSAQVNLPIRLDFLKLGTQLMRQLQGSEPLQYELVGSFMLGTDLPMMRRLNLPYRVSGALPLR